MVLGLALLSWLAPVDRAGAQGQSEANARLVAEDNYNRLTARMDELRDTQALHQQQISALDKTLRELAEQMARANSQAVTHESLGQLAEQIRKVDQTRVSENKLVREALENLKGIVEKIASTPPPAPIRHPERASSDPKPPSPPPMVNQEGFDYVVQKNDTLSGIIQAYRGKGIKVTTKSVTEANPTVKWERLRVGQKVFIPKPKE